MFGFSREFFENFEEAKSWGQRNKAAFLIGVYGLDEPGTKRKFQDQLQDAVYMGEIGEITASKVRAVVIWNR